MFPLPSYDSQFIILFQRGSGYVRRHIAVDVKASDYAYLETIAIEKAWMGMQADMMPTLNGNDLLRDSIFLDVIENKSPDLRINGELWEVEKSYNSKNMNNLKHAINEGSKQATNLIIDLSMNVDSQFMLRIVKGRFKDHLNLKIIEFRYEGNYTTFIK